MRSPALLVGRALTALRARGPHPARSTRPARAARAAAGAAAALSLSVVAAAAAGGEACAGAAAMPRWDKWEAGGMVAARRPASAPPPTAALIWCHGLGDTNHGWGDMLSQTLASAGGDHIKLVLPNAPSQPVTLNGGMSMPSWFDIRGLGPDTPEAAGDIEEAVAWMKELAAREVAAGIPAERVIFGGFSQGGAMALRALLTSEERHGGAVALSTWLTLRQTYEGKTLPEHVKDAPVFMGHGSSDAVVAFERGLQSKELVEAMGLRALEWKVYHGMAHSSCPQEMADLAKFLLAALPAGYQLPAPSEDEVRAMGVGALKKLITARGGSYKGLFEKSELVDAAIALLPSSAGGPAHGASAL